MSSPITDPPPPHAGPRRWLPSPGLALLLLLCGWYILTMSGHTYTSDEETMLAVAESLLARGSFALEPDFLMNYGTGSDDGQRYSRYGPGQSLAIVPFLLVGQLVTAAAPAFAEGFVVRLFVLLLPALVTATTGLLLYAWARELGYGVRVALLVGLLFGLCSLAWPYSRTLFAEPTATMLLVLCAYGLRRTRWHWWAIAGAAAGCALAVKVQVALALPLLAGYALLASWQGTWRASLRPVGGRIAGGLAGAVVPLGLLLFYNYALYGNPFTSGYGSLDPTAELGIPWQEGLYGLTLSTGKGLLLFSPVVLLGLAGLVCGWRRQWRESLLAVGMLLVHLAFYSRLNYWHGDGSWGPRYLVFVLPFLLLPAAGVLALLASWRNRLRFGGYGLVALVALVSFSIQWLPVLVNFNTYIQLSDQYQRLFVPAASPLSGHARLFGERLHEWSSRYLPPQNAVVLREGFSYSEGDRTQGEVLPRWTYANARMQLYPPQPDEPLTGRLVVGDHRPWPLERANFHLLLEGQPLPDVQRVDLTGENIRWEVRFTLPPEHVRTGTRLTLHSDTWNPTQALADNPRNEDLGLLLETLEVQQAGAVLPVREALPIPSVQPGRRDLWLWHYDTPNHHLCDVWLWYVLVAGVPIGTVLLLVALIGLPALVLLLAGGRGVWLALRE